MSLVHTLLFRSLIPGSTTSLSTLETTSEMAQPDQLVALDGLRASISALSASAAPLLATPLSEWKQDQDPLVQARLHIITNYAIHNLIWSECLPFYAYALMEQDEGGA